MSSGQIDVLASVTSLMERWKQECHNGSASPTQILQSLCEIVEQQTEVYFKTDPDPFGDRHPGRADPSCTLGHVLKVMLKQEDFIETLVRSYLSRDQFDLNSVTCRVLLNVMPGLEAFAVFKDHESSVTKLFRWAETAAEPLMSYSIGILAYIMESQEHASTFKESNHKLVPILMRRLHVIIQERTKATVSTRPFSQFSNGSKAADEEQEVQLQAASTASGSIMDTINKGGDFSNSSWHEMEPLYIQSYQLSPATVEVQQRLMLSYLTPMGEYQELLPVVFENRAMEIVFHYLDYQRNCDVRLGFVAVRYLASLLCHKKFGIEFIGFNGVQKFLKVPRPSLASTGLSLCLYYLALFEDTMERVCMLEQCHIRQLMDLVLWLLESSHQSGRMHAVMFLANALTFKTCLDIFDEKDGLRKLYNVLSTSEILNVESDIDFTDDQMYVFRQSIRHTAYTLKRYYESHACIMADEVRQRFIQSHNSLPEVNPHKTMKMSTEMLSEDTQLLLQYMCKNYWKPVAMFKKMSGVELFLKTITLVADWPAYSGKAESVRWLLDTLYICSVYPPIQQDLCKSVNLPSVYRDVYSDGVTSHGLSILLGMADTDILCEAEVQTSALNVIINLVCAPSDTTVMPLARRHKSSSSTPVSVHSASLQSLWDEFRQNNGIMVLLKLLTIQTPLTGADAIRALACQALVGLSRSDTMCQIMSKLPLFNGGQLQALMKEPVLQDKRYEQIKFCKYASQLIERVCGRPQDITELSLEHIRKAEVVQQTKIIYKEKELLQLIHDHLVRNGLERSAASLQQEAQLTVRNSTSPAPQSAQLYDPSAGHSSQLALPTTPKQTPSTPGSSTSLPRNTPSTPGGGLRFHLKNSPSIAASPDCRKQRPSTSNLTSKPAHSKPEHKTFTHNALSKKMAASNTDPVDKMTLDKIIISYFRKQHALCKNPVVTCPPFSLYEPHVCPEPARKNVAPSNLTARILKNSAHLNYGGCEGATLNRKYKYSRYKSVRTYKDSESRSSYSSCAFSACEQWLMLGNYSGDLKLYNIQAGEEAETYNCHNSQITHVEPSRDGMLLLTSSSWGRPLSALWTMDSFFDKKVGFPDDQYMEFSKSVQDKIVGTSENKALIYDVSTGTKICTLYDENKVNNYSRNQATFNCTDDLVLSDGVLWAVDSGKAIHKFDKFNPQVSGLFHPFGLEVIINSEIWDLRTFKLLHTVPALNQCQIRFSNDSSVLYGYVIPYDEEEEEGRKNLYGSSFRTFDSRNYSCLATIDVQRSISDLCTDKSDMHLAVIEGHGDKETLQDESQCRLYEVGTVKNAEEMPPGEEEDEGNDDDDDDDEEDEVEDGASEGEILDIVEGMEAGDEETDATEDMRAELMSLLADQVEGDLSVSEAVIVELSVSSHNALSYRESSNVGSTFNADQDGVEAMQTLSESVEDWTSELDTIHTISTERQPADADQSILSLPDGEREESSARSQDHSTTSLH